MSVVTHEAEMTCKSNKLAIEKSSGTFRNKLNEYENNIQQLTTDVNKIKNDFKTVKLNVNELHILKSKSEQVIASAETFDYSNVTEPFCKSRSTSINGKIDDLSPSTEPIQRNSINEHSHFQLPNTLVDSQRKHVRSSDVTNLSVLVKDIPVQSNIVNPAPFTSIKNNSMSTNNNITGNEQNTNIQVHFPTSMCNPTTVENFRGFVKKLRQRLSRFYVGGIDKHNSCEESMREYLAARGVNVTHLRYFDKPNRRTASAQLNIDAHSTTQPNEAFVNEPEYLMDTYKSYWNHGTVYILGDFNCKIGGPRYSFTRDRRSQLLESLLIDNNSISLHVQDFAKGPVCTFQSYEDGPKKGVDHIVTNNENTRDIYNVFVPDGSIFNVSDHNPIACTLLIEQCHADSDNLYESVMSDKVAWTKALERNSVNDYSFAVSQFLWSVQMSSLPATKEDIELYYKTIIDAVQKADKETLPNNQFVKHIKPYWTKVVDLTHKTMLKMRSLWILNGKVHDRSDQFFTDYKHAKRTFRNEMGKAYNEHIMNIANRMESLSTTIKDMYGRS
ncbi:unnamed protein product [Mytilus coruscus]|uniref:Endonuclease/exonuclease/phosphatase domain-containing protein n=1 Tax=Mytilus coruscus TaxID=42192 RepID=A0A6J8AW76_MYTCO|nr:unnamed protein product [Mytilus coruscus]